MNVLNFIKKSDDGEWDKKTIFVAASNHVKMIFIFITCLAFSFLYVYIWKVLMFVLKSVSVFIFPLCQPRDSFLAFIFPSLSALSLKVWSLDQEHQHHLGIHQKCRFLESTKDLLSQKLGSGPSRWLWCRLEFANHWPNVQTLSLN